MALIFFPVSFSEGQKLQQSISDNARCIRQAQTCGPCGREGYDLSYQRRTSMSSEQSETGSPFEDSEYAILTLSR